MQVNEQVSKATFKYINITAVSSLNSKQGANSIRSDFQNFIIAMMPNGNAKPEFKAKIIVSIFRGLTDYRQHVLLFNGFSKEEKSYYEGIAQFFEWEFKQYLKQYEIYNYLTSLNRY